MDLAPFVDSNPTAGAGRDDRDAVGEPPSGQLERLELVTEVLPDRRRQRLVDEAEMRLQNILIGQARAETVADFPEFSTTASGVVSVRAFGADRRDRAAPRSPVTWGLGLTQASRASRCLGR